MYKLMIVDDEQSIRRGIANGIPWNEWGFEVTAQASNGVEALEMIKQSKPDVVLSDIRMPEMDGVELMKRLNSEYPEIKIRCTKNVCRLRSTVTLMRSGWKVTVTFLLRSQRISRL